MPLANRRRTTRVVVLAMSAAAVACARPPGPGARVTDPADSSVAARVTEAAIQRHTRELADDRYEGRFPGTRGEELAVEYIEREMRRIGLAPGNPDGSYVQRFELLANRSRVMGTLSVRGETIPLSNPAEVLFAATGATPPAALRASEMVFVGYGITAPEYGWDDYAGIDVRGKTVLVMRGEPEARLANDSTRFDPALFRGPQLTWHAVLERKWQVAREHGAAAAVLVTRGLPGFRNHLARSRGEFIALQGDGTPGVVGFFQPAFTARVWTAAGRAFRDDSAAAGRRGFRAIPLSSTLTLDLQAQTRRIPTRNVIGRIEGADPRLRGEYVIYSAHWDAFGIGPAVEGDSIYNGAVDDAAGIGQMLAVAEALVAVRPRRTIVFLATSAEEHGLLGARHYAAHPLYPLERTLAAINFDIIDLAGPTRDVTLFGGGRSTLDELVADAARAQGRRVEGERAPQLETWFYQDHFAFVEAGVPALSVASGTDVVGRPAGWSAQRAAEYRTRHYHRPSDEVRPDWDWGSIVQDAQLGALLGLRLANGTRRPVWRTRAEFGERGGAP